MILSRKTGDGSARVITRDVTVINRLGVHARPAAMFVKVAGKFQSSVVVEKDGEQINGKSIMGLMMLAAGQGARLTITVEGPDAEAALRELEELFKNKFNED
jgi:phosphocarrier protein